MVNIERYEKFQVHHHSQCIQYTSQDQFVLILFGISIKEGGPKGIPVYGRFCHSIARFRNHVRVRSA